MRYNDNLLRYAQWYVGRGLTVFPCKPKDKIPATPHGCKDAVTDPAQIAAWWDGIHLYNIGIATGNGIVVLDVDVNHNAGKYGDETLEELERQYGPLPDTWMCLTGGGGIHYYFACDDPALTVGTGFAPGLDYRGNGGYVIAPPSTHENGREYVWEAVHAPYNTELATLPDWLHALMRKGRETPSKHDGSLDDGFEIVTHPMTLDYHIHKMPWKEVIQEALRLGYLSHKAGTCGLHVHVSRKCFGATEAEQENTIARILYFIENHWNEMLKFSRRTSGQMEKWAARYGRKDEPKAVLDSAKRSSKGRYSCVNIENDHTIEFRMFRGTLKYNTLIATLQMVDLICDVALSLTDCEIIDVTWSEFALGIPVEKYPELIQYLKERRLYVNDPVTIAEEV